MIKAKLLTATGVGTKLTIPTYDGSGEIIHLDVYHNADGWNAYPYWMVMTPYPGGNDQYENPSIVCSLDGNTWVVPEGLTNPIVAAPEGGFNSDTDMIVVGNTMYVIYRKYITATDTLHYMLMSSTNGVTWTEPIEIYAGLTGDTYGRGVAPSIVFTDNKFKIFSQAASRLAMRWSSSIDSGWSVGENLGYLPLEGNNPNHMNVTKHSDGRLFLISSPTTGELNITESSDYGATWTGYGQLGISAYRAAMVETPTGFDVWYATNNNEVYRTSLVEITGTPPLKNRAFLFETALDSQADGDVFQTSVALAAGDVTVSKDGGAFANITTLPTEISATGVLTVLLSADEMDASRVTVRFHDQAGDEWKDRLVIIQTETVQINDLATAADLSTVDGVVDAIKAKTDLLPADPADSSDIPTADIAAIKAKTDLLPASPAATGDIPTSGDVADAVWDELLSAHVIAGSSGAYLAASGAGSDPLLNTVPGSYPSGSAGDALGKIGSGQITTVSPVAQDGDVETIQGDDYDNAHGRALDWTDVSAAWPELTSATIAVVIGRALELVGSVVTATGASKKVRVELTDVQSAAIRVGVHRFQVIATLSDDDVITLVEANWTSRRRLEA